MNTESLVAISLVQGGSNVYLTQFLGVCGEIVDRANDIWRGRARLGHAVAPRIDYGLSGESSCAGSLALASCSFS